MAQHHVWLSSCLILLTWACSPSTRLFLCAMLMHCSQGPHANRRHREKDLGYSQSDTSRGRYTWFLHRCMCKPGPLSSCCSYPWLSCRLGYWDNVRKQLLDSLLTSAIKMFVPLLTALHGSPFMRLSRRQSADLFQHHRYSPWLLWQHFRDFVAVSWNPANIGNVRMQNEQSLPIQPCKNYRHIFNALSILAQEEG